MPTTCADANAIPQLVHGGLNNTADLVEDTDDATFKPCPGSMAVLRLRHGVRKVDGPTAHIGDPEQNSTGFVR